MSPLAASSLPFYYIQCLGFYLVIKRVVNSPLIIFNSILSHPESSAAVHTGHIYNISDSYHLCVTEWMLILISCHATEQAIEQNYLNFQAEFSPTSSSNKLSKYSKFTTAFDLFTKTRERQNLQQTLQFNFKLWEIYLVFISYHEWPF